MSTQVIRHCDNPGCTNTFRHLAWQPGESDPVWLPNWRQVNITPVVPGAPVPLDFCSMHCLAEWAENV